VGTSVGAVGASCSGSLENVWDCDDSDSAGDTPVSTVATTRKRVDSHGGAPGQRPVATTHPPV